MAHFQRLTRSRKITSRSLLRLLVFLGAIMWAVISVVVAAWLVNA